MITGDETVHMIQAYPGILKDSLIQKGRYSLERADEPQKIRACSVYTNIHMEGEDSPLVSSEGG
jgi:hypothetical protein